MANEPPFNSGRLFTVEHERFTSDDAWTPSWIFDRMAITFDLDVAAPPGGVPWVPADRHYTIADDGLAQPWEGRVWMNPPFSNTGPWVRRFVEHAHGVALLPLTKASWARYLWTAAEGVANCREETASGVSFKTDHGIFRPINPIMFFAFGADCLDAISRLGTVRRVG